MDVLAHTVHAAWSRRCYSTSSWRERRSTPCCSHAMSRAHHLLTASSNTASELCRRERNSVWTENGKPARNKRVLETRALRRNPREVDNSEYVLDPYGKVESAMSTQVVTVSPDAPVESILHHFEHYTGLPVVDGEGRCVGIISDVDVHRFAQGRSDSSIADTTVNNIMTSPAIVILEHAPITYAAGLMLRYKVHRIPVVNKAGVIVGIVTRNDLFEPLASKVDPLFHMMVARDKPSMPSEWY